MLDMWPTSTGRAGACGRHTTPAAVRSHSIRTMFMQAALGGAVQATPLASPAVVALRGC